MIGVILAAGRGTRLRPLTFFLPKPLLPWPRRSLINYQIAFLKGLGCKKVFVTIGYKGKILEFFLRKHGGIETIKVKNKGNAFFLSDLISKGYTDKILVITTDNLMSFNFKKFINSYNHIQDSFVVSIPSAMAQNGDFITTKNHKVDEIFRRQKSDKDNLLSGLQVLNLRNLQSMKFENDTDFHKVWEFLIAREKLFQVYFDSVSWRAIDRPKDLYDLLLSKCLNN